MKTKNWILKLKNDKIYRQHFFVFASMICSFSFAIYNGVIGFLLKSAWHESICIYYILLLFIKLIIFIQLKKNTENSSLRAKKKIKNAFIFTSILLFFVNLSLFAPIILMILNKRMVHFSLIFSIAIAAYTTYKIILAIIHFIKYKTNTNLMIKERKTIQLIEAIVSILTLQNTLIAVNSAQFTQKLFILTIFSSLLGLFFILFLTMDMFIKALKQNFFIPE